jgi:hypothetical protein
VAQPFHVGHDKPGAVALLIITFLRDYVREDVLGGQAPHEETLYDLAPPSSLNDLLLALLGELSGKLVTALHALGCDEKVAKAHQRHLGLLHHGRMGLADPSAHDTEPAPRPERVVICSMLLLLIFAWRGRAARVSSGSRFFVVLLDVYLSFVHASQ